MNFRLVSVSVRGYSLCGTRGAGQLSSRSSLGSQACDNPQQRKNWAGLWLYGTGHLFHILLFVAGSAQGWMVCCPHRPCTSSIFKDNLDSLEAWGASKLSDTVLSSGLLSWGSHGSAQMSVLTCMCLSRSLPDQRT